MFSLMSPSMSSFPRQLALALDHAESYAREDFLSGPPNEAALALIDSWPDWPGPGRFGKNASRDDLGGDGGCARGIRASPR
jgi:chromosomal replication initiation ATPase DnaA